MKGYSLTELMVVMSIIGILAMMQFYGMRSANDMEKLKAEQKQLLSHLRSLQNKAVNGELRGVESSHIITFNNNTSYLVDTTVTENLPTGMTISTNRGNVDILFHNPLRSIFTGICSAYLCQNGTTTIISQPDINIVFTYNGNTKTVRLEGSGSRINRMYLVN